MFKLTAKDTDRLAAAAGIFGRSCGCRRRHKNSNLTLLAMQVVAIILLETISIALNYALCVRNKDIHLASGTQ